jgi:hypothetical protein
MNKTCIFFVLAFFTFNVGNAQVVTPTTVRDSIVFGYYYCFAMFGSDPVYYTSIFSEPEGDVAVKPLIDQSWQNYVNNVLKLPQDLALTAGPFQTKEYAFNDRQVWLATIPDSVSKTEVQYMFSLNH